MSQVWVLFFLTTIFQTSTKVWTFFCRVTCYGNSYMKSSDSTTFRAPSFRFYHVDIWYQGATGYFTRSRPEAAPLSCAPQLTSTSDFRWYKECWKGISKDAIINKLRQCHPWDFSIFKHVIYVLGDALFCKSNIILPTNKLYRYGFIAGDRSHPACRHVRLLIR